jgi:hypothetical protein
MRVHKMCDTRTARRRSHLLGLQCLDGIEQILAMTRLRGTPRRQLCRAARGKHRNSHSSIATVTAASQQSQQHRNSHSSIATVTAASQQSQQHENGDGNTI